MPDFGEPRVHPTAGAIVVGARKPLIAYNINLHTADVEVAKKIASFAGLASCSRKYSKMVGCARPSPPYSATFCQRPVRTADVAG